MPRVPTDDTHLLDVTSPGGIRVNAPQAAGLTQLSALTPPQAPQLRIDTPRPFNAETVDKLPPIQTPQFKPIMPPGLTPEIAAISGQQLSRFGQNVDSFGNDIGNIALKLQDEANVAAVAQATMQARNMSADLTTGDGQNGRPLGFTNIKGYDAVARPGDKPLADEYLDHYQDGLDKISENLKSDAQRRQFALVASSLKTELYNRATGHEAQQYNDWKASIYSGTVQSAQQHITDNYTNPNAVERAIYGDDTTGELGIVGATQAAGRMAGKSEREINADVALQVSAARSKVVLAAAADGNIAYANAYLNQYAKPQTNGFTAPDLIRLKDGLRSENDTLQGFQAAQDAVGTAVGMHSGNGFTHVLGITAQNTPGLYHTPAPDAAKIEAITAKAESNNNPNAVSPAGAKGIMQVLDGTNKDPGFGVRPAQDDSPQERARVGRDYLAAMIKHYNGDNAKAWAAYNWGPGHVDKLLGGVGTDGMTKDGKFWLAATPVETQRYVTANMKALGDPHGVDAPMSSDYQKLPTLEDMLVAVRQSSYVQGNPRALKIAEEEVTRQHAAMVADQAQKWENARQAALDGVEKTGSYDALPYEAKAALKPEDRALVRERAHQVALGEDPVTPDAMKLKLNDTSYLVSLNDAQYAALKPQLSRSDFETYDKQRQELRSGKLSPAPETIDQEAFNAALNSRLHGMGLGLGGALKAASAKATEVDQMGAITADARRRLVAAQVQLGKKFDPIQIDKFLDHIFTRTTMVQDTFLGMNVGAAHAQAIYDQGGVKIPSQDREAIVKAFKTNGIANPSERDIATRWLSRQPGYDLKTLKRFGF